MWGRGGVTRAKNVHQNCHCWEGTTVRACLWQYKSTTTKKWKHLGGCNCPSVFLKLAGYFFLSEGWHQTRSNITVFDCSTGKWFYHDFKSPPPQKKEQALRSVMYLRFSSWFLVSMLLASLWGMTYNNGDVPFFYRGIGGWGGDWRYQMEEWHIFVCLLVIRLRHDWWRMTSNSEIVAFLMMWQGEWFESNAFCLFVVSRLLPALWTMTSINGNGILLIWRRKIGD